MMVVLIPRSTRLSAGTERWQE